MAHYRRMQIKNGVYFMALPIGMIKAMQALPGDYFKVSMVNERTMMIEHITNSDKCINLNLEDKNIKYVAIKQ